MNEHHDDEQRSGTERRAVAPNQMRVAWGDKSISLVGLHSIVVAVLVVVLLYLAFLLNRSVDGTLETVKAAIAQHDLRETEEHQGISNEHVAISEELRRHFGQLSVGQSKIAEAMDAQTFLMTKSDAERRLYKLDMPDSFRKRIR